MCTHHINNRRPSLLIDFLRLRDDRHYAARSRSSLQLRLMETVHYDVKRAPQR